MFLQNVINHAQKTTKGHLDWECLNPGTQGGLCKGAPQVDSQT